MKRYPALVRLSWDHHHGLVLARRIEKELPGASDEQAAELYADLVRFWAAGLLPHFRAEGDVCWRGWCATSRTKASRLCGCSATTCRSRHWSRRCGTRTMPRSAAQRADRIRRTLPRPHPLGRARPVRSHPRSSYRKRRWPHLGRSWKRNYRRLRQRRLARLSYHRAAGPRNTVQAESAKIVAASARGVCVRFASQLRAKSWAGASQRK